MHRDHIDDLLIENANLGSRDSFRALVKNNQDRLYASLHCYLGCPNLARNLVLKTFVKAFSDTDSDLPRSNFVPWLFRIAFQLTAATSWDSLERNETNEVGLYPIAECLLSNTFVNAFASLNDDQRAVLALREIANMTYSQISFTLQISPDLVRRRVSRARWQLHASMDLHDRKA